MFVSAYCAIYDESCDFRITRTCVDMSDISQNTYERSFLVCYMPMMPMPLLNYCLLFSGSVLRIASNILGIKNGFVSLGIQSYSDIMIGMFNHLRNALYLDSMNPFSGNDWIPRVWGLACVLGSSLDSHYFHIIGDGHQPNSRGLYTHYKDFGFPIKGGMTIPNTTSSDPGSYDLSK